MWLMEGVFIAGCSESNTLNTSDCLPLFQAQWPAHASQTERLSQFPRHCKPHIDALNTG